MFLVSDFLSWYFFDAPKSLLGVLENYLISTWHRFFIGRHLHTLFAPWHRVMPSDYAETNQISERIINAVVGVYVRLLAAVVRLFIIFFGLISELAIGLAFIILIVVWILWPVILIILLSMAFKFITS